MPDPNTLAILEYQTALEALAAEAQSPAGRAAALALRPVLSPEQVLSSWGLIDEGRALMNAGCQPDIGDHLDLSAILEPLKVQGSRLGPEELRAVGLEAACCRRVSSIVSAASEEAPRLAALASEISVFPELIDNIERSIGPDGEILDSASSELARLRMEQAATRQGISGKLSQLMQSDGYRHIIQDELITTRSDRYVLPVRAGAAGPRRGLVHDWSHSGATAFMEPLEVVEDNNRLGLLKRKEKSEIERILLRLSEQCRSAAPALLASGAIVTRLDLIMAQARLSRAWSALAPRWEAGGGFELKSARHPLLMERLKKRGGRMTPLDLVMSPAKPVVIISGLNTGGKTVAMKTLGLNLVLAKAGLHLPVAEGSRLELPDNIVAVMGDEQDLSSDLSTFSGHVRSLKRVLAEAGPGVLILLDEIGSGTDPAEGAALGLAVLERLKPSGALVMAATHYHLIKSWAALSEGVESVAVNASDSGQPLYGLSYGSPGFSGGLKMARRLGLDEDLVDRAESYLDDGQRRALELLAKLDEERSAIWQARQQLQERQLSLARSEAALREEKQRLAQENKKQAEEQSRRINELLTESRRDFEALKAQMLQAAGGSGPSDSRLMGFNQTRARLEKKLREARPQPSRPEDSPLTELKIGQRVRVARLGREAVVRSLNLEKGEAWVDADGLHVKAALSELFAPEPQAESSHPRRVGVTVSPAEGAGSSLNLLGHTVEEALAAVEKELDRALHSGLKSLYIIHGYGTGRLRQAIRGYLKRHPRVSVFERAPQNAGGDGVTVVSLE